jgi:hypothetical protein
MLGKVVSVFSNEKTEEVEEGNQKITVLFLNFLFMYLLFLNIFNMFFFLNLITTVSSIKIHRHYCHSLCKVTDYFFEEAEEGASPRKYKRI